MAPTGGSGSRPSASPQQEGLTDMLKNGMLNLLMGLEAPTAADHEGTITWEMKRPPRGFTDILYLDDKLKVTRGNKGTVVAVVRGTAP
mmetsp:Transcript_98454/g.278836  ORF Transcript_98454/g.278836 Transcript_98454/m.278836 type:complete len:88 (+) Transcript_98454:495-758(+)